MQKENGIERIRLGIGIVANRRKKFAIKRNKNHGGHLKNITRSESPNTTIPIMKSYCKD